MHAMLFDWEGNREVNGQTRRSSAAVDVRNAHRATDPNSGPAKTDRKIALKLLAER